VIHREISILFYEILITNPNYMKTNATLHRSNSKTKVSLKDAFTKENILRALRESTDDQRKVLTGK
jgi:hypothetical protein